MSAHVSVLLQECLEGLRVREDGSYVDATLGRGGHSSEILKRCPNGHLYAFDRDQEAILQSRERLAAIGSNFTCIHSRFSLMKEELAQRGVTRVDGILMDLGVSSWQIDNFDRGFSYRSRESRLDMRMDKQQALSAYEVVNEYGEDRLREIISQYGEEKFAARIAFNICKYRQIKPLETTGELIDVIERSMPPKLRYAGGHPAKRTFQAIRIEVNGELDGLGEFIEEIVDRLETGGRIAVITFHSLEDRIVKQKLKWLEKDCVCPPKTPVCVCGKKAKVKVVTNKPITADSEERQDNPRSESAKLRIAQRI